MPLSFAPEYVDSTLTYDLSLAVRHSNSYHYRNLSLVVDVIAADTTVNRKVLDISLADEYGSWSSGGFGALYQAVVPLVSDVAPDDAHRVVVWQAMAGCDTLFEVVDVGIIVTPL